MRRDEEEVRRRRGGGEEEATLTTQPAEDVHRAAGGWTQPQAGTRAASQLAKPRPITCLRLTLLSHSHRLHHFHRWALCSPCRPPARLPLLLLQTLSVTCSVTLMPSFLLLLHPPSSCSSPPTAELPAPPPAALSLRHCVRYRWDAAGIPEHFQCV